MLRWQKSTISKGHSVALLLLNDICDYPETVVSWFWKRCNYQLPGFHRNTQLRRSAKSPWISGHGFRKFCKVRVACWRYRGLTWREYVISNYLTRETDPRKGFYINVVEVRKCKKHNYISISCFYAIFYFYSWCVISLKSGFRPIRHSFLSYGPRLCNISYTIANESDVAHSATSKIQKPKTVLTYHIV